MFKVVKSSSRQVVKSSSRQVVKSSSRQVVKNSILALFISLSLVNLNGCAAVLAAKQPDKKNLNAITVGTPRNIVLAEWGVPVHTEVRSDKHRVDIYSFRQGYSNFAKFGRATLHTVASAATLGLWEVVGTPSEVAFDGKYVAFQVIYNEQDIAISVQRLK